MGMYRDSMPMKTNWTNRTDRLNSLPRLCLRMALSAVCVAGLLASAEAQPLSDADSNASRRQPFPGGRFMLERDDVLAFLGGADVAAAQHTGSLEALLTAQHRGRAVRFRNFGWEGDTVFAQPRDIGFPSIKAHLQRAGASVIVLQFGRSEALGGLDALPGFVSAYEKLLDECAQQTPRLVLVAPPPFEKAEGLLPDLSLRNADLAEYASAIRDLARRRVLPFLDLFGELGGMSHREPRLTDNGLQLTPRGQALVAHAFVRQLGFGSVADLAGEPDEYGTWPNAGFERLRQTVVAKNRLWFNYWRPHNWAFLGGDRTSQPSSRDYRDPNIRWFPEEMEKFVPLIESKETEIAKLADKLL
ncbi:MAG: hypothetical protein EXS31_12930 [Pedosphaera sp.]|nr:hypothetical protein [Pedosphaera sp.]